MRSDCEMESKDDDEYAKCDALVITLDSIGFITARLARLNLGVSLLLSQVRSSSAAVSVA